MILGVEGVDVIVCSLLYFLIGMATIKEAANKFNLFVFGFEDTIKKTIVNNRLEIIDYVKEQLYSGVNGNGNPLRPTYLNDPWFETKEAGRWYKNASGYAKWKKRHTPPLPSYLGIQARDMYTPNLVIRGDFYDSITAIPIDDGISIHSRGVSFSGDIERKYGNTIYRIGPQASEHFIKYVLSPALRSYYSKFGL